MDNSAYVSLSLLTALERQLDVTANNLANVNSSGFKAERVLFESYLQPESGTAEDGGTNYVLDRGSYVDRRQGALVRTDNPLDVALNGTGWFGYRTAEGQTAYGRDGGFVLDAQGRLVTQSGAQVLDAAGGPIALPPDIGGTLTISADGTISSPGAGVLAQLGAFDLPQIQSFERIGGGLLVPPADQDAAALPDAETQFIQGSIESSNVEAITEVTRLVATQQAYQRAVNLMSSEDDLRKDMLSRIGRPSF
ncbi:flagellar hook basal-body protein [Pseudooceanicola aestuarii]|uniref:flagellar hook basal-body protein n=1 Tax=Pseudooceanicola aestuarii TaxID=2697319 RepID=UPI0013D735A5|nr:flagellar hook basal-body protein [Pseudooceanicola aestuarii]